MESAQDIRVLVRASADPEYFVAHVDLTTIAQYTAEAAKAGGPHDASWARCATSTARRRS